MGGNEIEMAYGRKGPSITLSGDFRVGVLPTNGTSVRRAGCRLCGPSGCTGCPLLIRDQGEAVIERGLHRVRQTIIALSGVGLLWSGLLIVAMTIGGR